MEPQTDSVAESGEEGDEHPAAERVGESLLMEKIRDGDHEAFGILLRRHWPWLLDYVIRVLADHQVAQDVAQRTFIRVWQARAYWEPRGSVKSYLIRIARRLAFNARRDQRLRRERHQEAGRKTVTDRNPDPASVMEEEDLRAEVEAAIARLSERRREVFVLSRFQGMSHREIAESLGTSPQTVANQMTAALAELRDLLAHHLSDD